LPPAKIKVRQGIGPPEKAKKIALIHKGTMGGTPCIKGTRSPVHLTAEGSRIADGSQRGS